MSFLFGGSPTSPPPAAPPSMVSGVTHGVAFGPEQLGDVQRLVQATLSADAQERTQATDRVEQLKHHPGWRACVLQIALGSAAGSGGAGAVSEELRTMCLILFKNQVELLFRRTFGPATLSRDTEEKDLLKNMLLQFHADGDAAQTAGVSGVSDRVSGLVSVCVGMVARHEWPAKWPALFPRLLEGLQAPAPRTVSRTLYTLHQVMKAMQTSRLCTSRAKFQTATEAILTCVRTQWIAVQEHSVNTIGAVVASGNAQAFTPELNASLVESCKLSLLFLKCLRRLILYGVGDLGTSAETNILFPFFLDQLTKLVQLLPKLSIAPTATNPHPAQFPFLEHLFSCALLMLRTVHQALDGHAAQFKNFFMPFAQFSIHVLQHNATALTNASPLDIEGAAELGAFPDTTALEPLCIECMQYLQAVVRLYSRPPPMQRSLLVAGLALQRAHEGGAGGAQVDQTMSQIYTAMEAVFTPDLLRQLLTLLLQHYLVLKHADMEMWQSEPETFYNEERSGCNDGDDGSGDDATLVVMNARGDSSGQSQEHTLRMVAETLIKIMMEKHSDVIAPALMQMLMSMLGQCPPASQPTHVAGQPNLLLLKESIYSALGYGYLHIPLLLQSTHNTNFPRFFTEVLAKELENQSSAYKIIRRRVIWLVGEWVEQVTDESRMPIYHAIVCLLKENDLLVRMTAIDTLYKLIDNVSYSFEHGLGGDTEDDVLDLTAETAGTGSAGFEAMLNQFSVHLSDVLSLLFQILQHQLEELPTKQHVLFTISKIVGAMKSRIMSSGCLETLLHHLPLIWRDCVQNNQNLLRTSILDVITKLVVALDYKSQAIHQVVVLPMLAYVLDPKNTAKETNLWVEQGLELWKHTLQQCVTYTPQLGELFPALLAYMSGNAAHLQLCVEIIESYIHLGREDFMKPYAGHIGEVFASLLVSSNAVRPEVVSSKGIHAAATDDVVTEQAIVVLMPVLEAIAQIYPMEVPQLFQRTFHCMIQAFLDSWRVDSLNDEQQHNSPIHVPSDQVLAGYFTVLGRLFFQNYEGSMQLLVRLSGSGPGQFPIAVNELLATLLEVWSRKLNSIVNVYKKKVCVLGMVNAVQTADPIVLAKLKHVMSCVRRVEMELAQPGAYLEQPDWSPALNTPPEQRIESHRIQLMLKEDPSNNLGVRGYFLEKLTVLTGVIGEQQLQHLITTAVANEPHVWTQIRDGNFGPAPR